MITVKEISEIPELDFADRAMNELKVAFAHTPLWSPKKWLISADEPLFVCGVYQVSLMIVPEFWILACQGWLKRPVMATRTAIRLIPPLLRHYPHLRARAPLDDRKSRRLIEVAGFTQIAEKDGFAWYEVRA